MSVGVITYNQKEHLRECLESVLSQDYPNFEVVVGDDASRDGTQDLLRDYATRYPGKFRLELAEVNQGITGNCNRVFCACTGEYIAWMGGDDLMLPGKLRRLVAVLEADVNLAIAVSPVDMFDSETGKTLSIHPSSIDGLQEYGARELVRAGNCITGPAGMVRRSMCPTYGFDTRIPVVSDFLYYVETAMNGRVKVVEEVLSRYRRHPQQASASYAFLNRTDAGISCQIIEDKYPQFIPEVTRLRADFNYMRGLFFFNTSKDREARILMRQSLRQKINPKIVVWLFIFTLPAPLRERFRRWWLVHIQKPS